MWIFGMSKILTLDLGSAAEIYWENELRELAEIEGNTFEIVMYLITIAADDLPKIIRFKYLIKGV